MKKRDRVGYSWKADALGGVHMFVNGANTAYAIAEQEGSWSCLRPDRSVLARGFTMRCDAEMWLQRYYEKREL